jgi:hypothetical protein
LAAIGALGRAVRFAADAGALVADWLARGANAGVVWSAQELSTQTPTSGARTAKRIDMITAIC